jgi:hypothetical protein
LLATCWKGRWIGLVREEDSFRCQFATVTFALPHLPGVVLRATTALHGDGVETRGRVFLPSMSLFPPLISYSRPRETKLLNRSSMNFCKPFGN